MPVKPSSTVSEDAFRKTVLQKWPERLEQCIKSRGYYFRTVRFVRPRHIPIPIRLKLYQNEFVNKILYVIVFVRGDRICDYVSRLCSCCTHASGMGVLSFASY